jgi:NAD(P)H-hydrate epimerase
MTDSTPTWDTLAWDSVPKLTSHQMQQLLTLTTGKYGVDARLVVEHAGRNLAELAAHFAPDGPVLVVAGRGNNGSGGLAAARLLAGHGRQVWVVPTHEAENYSGIPKEQLELLRHFPTVRVRSSLPKMKFPCVIDAAIGTSLEGPPRGRTLDVITVVNGMNDACVISLDTPTGMVADDGSTPGDVIRATLTLALALPKAGVTPGSAAGDIYLGDIGVPPGVLGDMGLPPAKLPGFITKLEARS